MDDIAKECRDRLKLSRDAEDDNRAMGLDDLRFAAGEQWPAESKAQRTLEKRPCLTINKTDTFCRSIENNMRQQRPRIKIHPISGGADKMVADVLEGMVRHIEVNSNADLAYDTGGHYQVRMGWGYWRVIAKYIGDDSFDQELCIDRIRNPFSVYLDPSHVSPDGCDSNWGIVTTPMRKEDFKREYPGADPMDYPDRGAGDDKAQWANRNEVVVAEYLRFSDKKERLYLLSDGRKVFKSSMPSPESLAAAGIEVAGDRESVRRQLKWSKVTGAEELEKQDLPGRYLPIVPVYGAELLLDGKVVRYGAVRQAMDPQRMYNYWRPLSLDTPIPTPTGWRQMRDLHAGDQVFDEQGNPCNVIGESPVHINRRCFRVEFDDGSHVVADGEHPWTVEERGKRAAATYKWERRDVSTMDLRPGKHFIQIAKPLQLPDADLPIDPYLLGVWLGDGATAEPQITQGDGDIEQMRANLVGLGLNLGGIYRDGSKAGRFTVLGVRAKFTKAGLLGKKHIPAEYLRASESQRWALLQGLMDTDGSVSSVGQCSFTNTNPQIATGFGELLASLGIKAKSCIRSGRVRMWADGTSSDHADAWQFSFSAHDDQPVFRLSRKQRNLPGAHKRHERRVRRFGIRSLIEVSSVPVKCIAVDTPTHLFLAGPSMVPTHNTQETEFVALAPKAPWLMVEGQDEGYEDEWNTANIRSYSRLKYKSVSDETGAPLPPPMRQQPQAIPAASVNAAMGASEDMKAVFGMFDPALGAPGQETSGTMVRQRQQQSDLSNYHFYDNLTRSIRHTGKILLDLIPHYYDTERIMRIIGEDGQPKSVTINQKQRDAYGAVLKVLNDVTVGTYDVVMDTGPGYQTRRQEGAEMMIETLKALPQVGQVAGDLIVRQMDYPGSGDIADRLESTNPIAMAEKKLPDDMPPEAKSLVANLQGMVQQMQQHIQQLEFEKKAKVWGDSQWQNMEMQKTHLQEQAANQREAVKAMAKLYDTDTKADAGMKSEHFRAQLEILLRQMETENTPTTVQ
jgi:intein/homing endonuclease